MPRGGYRLGAGRPRKSTNDKKLEGRVVVALPGGIIKPKKIPISDAMLGYFAIVQKECPKEVPSAEDLRIEIEDYIAARGCEGFVAPQMITDYVLNRQGFLTCEAMNRKLGRMTKDLKVSPYVMAGAQYYKAMQSDLNLIMHMISRHSATQREERNTFLELLLNRGF